VQAKSWNLTWILQSLAALYLAFSLGATWEYRQLKEVVEAARALHKTGSNASGLEPLAWQPRIFLARGVISPDEATHLVDLVIKEKRLKPSTTDTGESGAGRTSSTAWLQALEDTDPVISKLVDRMHSLAMVPREHGEPLAIARYGRGEYYGWHIDSDEKESRLATVLVYLNSPLGGGETIFPFAKASSSEGPAKPPPFSPQRGPDASAKPLELYCKGATRQHGLRVKPRAGDALVFFSHSLQDHAVDHIAWHASCPVTEGEKWIAQRWIKTMPFRQYVEKEYNVKFSDWQKAAEMAEKKRSVGQRIRPDL